MEHLIYFKHILAENSANYDDEALELECQLMSLQTNDWY